MKNNWVDYRNTNGIFKTGLLSFQHLLLDWYETAQYNIKAKANFQVFSLSSLMIFNIRLTDILPVLTDR